MPEHSARRYSLQPRWVLSSVIRCKIGCIRFSPSIYNASSYYRVGRIWFLILRTVGNHTIYRRKVRKPAGIGERRLFSGQGQEQVQGQGRKGFYFMQISKAVQGPTNRWFKKRICLVTFGAKVTKTWGWTHLRDNADGRQAITPQRASALWEVIFRV